MGETGEAGANAAVRSAPALLRYALPAAVAVPILSALALLLLERERVVSLETGVALWVELENLALLAVSVLTAFAIRAAERRRRAIEVQLEELAHRDSLTGLLNRRGLETELGRAPRDDRRGLAVVLLDLDDFKRINDTRGHPAGDRVLTEVGRALGAAHEAGELVARLGGDEFALVVRAGEDGARILEAVKTTSPTCTTVYFGPAPIQRENVAAFLDQSNVDGAVQVALGRRDVRGVMTFDEAAFSRAPAECRVDIRPLSELAPDVSVGPT